MRNLWAIETIWISENYYRHTQDIDKLYEEKYMFDKFNNFRKHIDNIETLLQLQWDCWVL